MAVSETFSGLPSASGSVFSMPMKSARKMPSNSRTILDICQKPGSASAGYDYRKKKSGARVFSAIRTRI
jgi:hypothetical protein